MGDSGRRCPCCSHKGGGVITPKKKPRRRMRKKGSRHRTTRFRGTGGIGRRLKLVPPSKDGRRDLGERAHNCQRMRNLKGCDIGALVYGKRVTVVSGKSEKSRIAPLGNVSPQRVKIPVHVEVVARKRGKDKNCGTGERRRRRGVGGAFAAGAGGGKNAGGGERSSIGSIIYTYISVII